jgi:Pentapeptide repeats (8 copies)
LERTVNSGFAFYVSVVANVIKIAEVLVVLWGARQLWLGRGERQQAEREAAEIARKAANYQAWQVVNTAQGKGGSGGRVDALQDLVRNGVSLAGVQLDDAWLEGLVLPGADMRLATLRHANLRGADLRNANLEQADLTGVDLTGANLGQARLTNAQVRGAVVMTTDLRGADLTGLRGWDGLASASYLLLEGARHAPRGFIEWALEHGASLDEPSAGEPLDTDRRFSQEWRSA